MPSHQDNATQIDIIRGSTTNKKWIYPHCIIATATTDSITILMMNQMYISIYKL